MYEFLIVVGVVLLISVIWMVYRIQTLVSVVKGSDKKIASGSNKINAALFVVWLVVIGGLMFWYSIKEFHNYQLPIGSEHGVITDKLFWITMAVTGIVFILTHVLLFVFPYKYQYSENRKADFFPDNNKLEVIWTIVPGVVLAGLVISGWMAWSDITAPAPDNAHVVEIMGYQFAWDVRYPGKDKVLGDYDYRLTTASNSHGVDFTDKNSVDDFPSPKIVIPKGEPVLFKIRARDVLHSVFAPHMRLKMDAVPGMPTRFWFVPSKTTEEMRTELNDPEFEYEIACTEVCGRGHFSMRKVIEVVEPAAYQKWLTEQKTFIQQNPALAEVVSVETKELAEIQLRKN
jgi:cytochrome c oxidase subunit 2